MKRRRDANHAEIVRALKQVGTSVIDTSAVGIAGAPDLICARAGLVYLLEIKNPASRYGKAGASQVQQGWAATWNGPPPLVVTSVDEALKAVGAI